MLQKFILLQVSLSRNDDDDRERKIKMLPIRMITTRHLCLAEGQVEAEGKGSASPVIPD